MCRRQQSSITQRAGDGHLQGAVMGWSHDQESLMLVALDLSVVVTHTQVHPSGWSPQQCSRGDVCQGLSRFCRFVWK